MTSDRRRIYVAGFIYFLLLLWVASYFGTWADEEYSLATSAHGIGYALHRSIDYELQAPLYFMLLALWREIDPSVWFSRLLSLLFAVGLFFTLVRIGERIAPRRDALPFALLASLNPFVVVAALQIRLYSLALFLSALMWLFFDMGFANGTSKRARVAFVAVAIAGIYTQYFTGFALVGFAIALAILGRYKALGSYVACAAGVGITALPLLKFVRSQAGNMAQTPTSHFSLVYQTALHPWLEFIIPHFYTPAGETSVEHVLYLAIAILVGLCWAWFAPNFTRKLLATVSVAVAVEIIYVALAVVVDQRLNDRYFIALYVPVAAAVYAFLRSGTANPPVPQRTFATVLTIMTIGALISQYRFLAQNGDWIRVAQYVTEHARPNDVIAIYPPDNMPAFQRQYRGTVRYVSFPRPNPQDHYVLSALAVHSPEEAKSVLDGLRPYGTLWFVDGVRCVAGLAPEYGCDNLEKAVAAGFTTESKTVFYANEVLELRPNGSGATAAK